MLISVIDIADYIYRHPTLLELSLEGIWMADRKFLMFMALHLLNVFMQH